mmetsp:Transcript_6077/g.13837  ORF Transcript_6077/g.13837 Transcript_6077/m.13837 type:complete len:844 (-) Transcript_6077:631-3162(-)|eukprot:CAMPEP_0114569320 /NCGR_PEP_ID=MMETSP0114-20121206/16563_1 /TAXON_ID=31324 /ORGANISM="Goniomonas sp, Strain m" /LENGTH=843 /DNA_ID=CAMNT_0001756191 /DNA_START=27 /DNA_END=2558 /DNA_ORIENTATION=-
MTTGATDTTLPNEVHGTGPVPEQPELVQVPSAATEAAISEGVRDATEEKPLARKTSLSQLAAPPANGAGKRKPSGIGSDGGKPFHTKLSEVMSVFGRSDKVVPVHGDDEDGADHMAHDGYCEQTIQSNAKRKKPEPKALIGSGTEEDAERHAFTLIMLTATVFALFGTDLYELCGPPSISNDKVLYTLVTIVFFCFLIEFCFYSLFKPGYVGSFFFYLDFIAAVSLLPDVFLLWDIELFASGGGGLAVARAGRAARAGTRAARVVRIFKLFSLLRRGKKQEQKQMNESSKIGTKLTNGITQKVIMIVALMLISSQMMDLIATAEAFANNSVVLADDLDNLELLFEHSGGDKRKDPFHMFVIKFLNDMNKDPGVNCPPVALFATHGHLDTHDCTTRYLRVGGVDIWGDPFSFGDLRTTPTERSRVESHNGRNVVLNATVGDARSEALVNILTVSWVTIVLAISSALFSRDSDRLVISPLETMARLVRNLAHDPLGTMQLDVEDEQNMDSETRLVAQAILKLSAMLQVGFGEAGASIIQQNMADSDSDHINPVIPGKRITGIFGFCDIRNFTDCTECLQQDVMVFVNRISSFVHKAVKDNEGAPNKNIGDAFLLVWDLSNRPKGPLTAGDSALKALLRIIIETAADPVLTELTNRPAVQNRIPGYATKMGFGLHIGWGIEGAIGSVMKIDASYLSPNVNMCARLEGATKQYGCVMLLTGDFYDILTKDVQKLCRRVDRVTAVGSNVPFDLYTYDSVRTPDLASMREGHTFWERFPPTTSVEFRKTFEAGIKLYIDGSWPEARDKLMTALREEENDGPAKFIISVMEAHDFVAPAKWNGCRVNGVE